MIPDVGALWGFGGSATARLNLVEDLEGDDAFVLCFQPVQAVALGTDVPGVDRLREDIRHALLLDLAVLVAREVREALKEALHFGLGLEPTRSVTFEGLSYDDIKRRIRAQHPPFSGDFDVLHPDWRVVNPEARFHPCLHLLFDLARIGLAFQLTCGSDHDLVELAFRRVHEGEVEAGADCPAGVHLPFQPKVELHVAGIALEVVEDDHEALIRMRIEERQKRPHAGALHEVATACLCVREDSHNLEPLGGGVFLAT